MSKLSTDQIKLLISQWLSDPKIKEELRAYHIQDDDDQGRIDQQAKWFDLPPGSTADAVRDRIWQLWCDGSEWKRDGKRRLGEEWEDYIYQSSGMFGDVAGPSFIDDFCGGSSDMLVRQFATDPTEAARCWHRCFVPNNELGDNFRLEVITTPDDTEVVGWVVIVD